MANLASIKQPVALEMREFQGHFKEAMRTSVPLLDHITRYIVRSKGKQMRPLLVYLSAAASGGTQERTHIAATLIELLHTATLVHDDVVDAADTRRGFLSISALWKSKIAVLVGDYLLSRGLLISMQNDGCRPAPHHLQGRRGHERRESCSRSKRPGGWTSPRTSTSRSSAARPLP